MELLPSLRLTKSTLEKLIIFLISNIRNNVLMRQSYQSMPQQDRVLLNKYQTAVNPDSFSSSVMSHFSSKRSSSSNATRAESTENASNDEQDSSSEAPAGRNFNYTYVLKVVAVLAVVFGVGIGVPVSIANGGEKCCRGGDDKFSLLHYCKNTDPIDMWDLKSGRNCDYYEDYPQACDVDSDVLVRSICFDDVHWRDDVTAESCAQTRRRFVRAVGENSDEEKAWCATGFGETKQASRKDENGDWIYVPVLNMAAQAACCFCGQKRKTENFESFSTPKKHCCGCRVWFDQVGNSVEEKYRKKVSDEGGSCDPSTDRKVKDLGSGELVSRNEICSNDSNLGGAWAFAIIWWVVVGFLTWRKYFRKYDTDS